MRRMARICNAKCILTSQACTRFSSARSVCFIAPSERESRTSRASHRSHVSPRWPCTPMSRVPRTQPQWKHQPHDARECLLQALQRRSAQGGNTAFFNSAIPVFLQVSALRKIWRVLGFARCCYYSPSGSKLCNRLYRLFRRSTHSEFRAHRQIFAKLVSCCAQRLAAAALLGARARARGANRRESARAARARADHDLKAPRRAPPCLVVPSRPATALRAMQEVLSAAIVAALQWCACTRARGANRSACGAREPCAGGAWHFSTSPRPVAPRALCRAPRAPPRAARLASWL